PKLVFTLPPARVGGRSRPGAAPGRPERAAQVLVIAEDLAAAYVIKGVLMAGGHRVQVAADADDALAWARERKPQLVVVDLGLTGADAAAVVEIVKHDPETRKCAVVAVGERRGLLHGADATFPKPVDVDKFRETC